MGQPQKQLQIAGLHSSTLCSVCARLDIAEYFRREIHRLPMIDGLLRASADAICLGPVDEIYRKSNSCAFCFLVTKALSNPRHRPIFEDLGEVLHPGVQCWVYSYCCGNNTHPDYQVDSKAYRVSVAIAAGSDFDGDYRMAEIQLLGEDAVKLGLSPVFQGRKLLRPDFDMSLARKWLETCESKHGPLCDTPGREVEDRVPPLQPTELLAIDLGKMCVCCLPEGSRYAALSYCWPGDRHYLTLTQTSFLELFKEDAFAMRMAELPKTIQDAVSCAKELQFRYLWVDALCIIQDDDEHKTRQLQQMDRVYGSAVLTIVAAYPVLPSSPDPCGGLPGYSTNWKRTLRQEIREVQGLNLMLPSGYVQWIVGQTRWNTRSWTLQKSILSRRVLYFTHVQTYFQCSCNVFCEDSVGEDVHSTAFIYPGTTLWNRACPYNTSGSLGKSNWGRLSLSRAPYRNIIEVMSAYEFLVEDYTSRNMSDSADILNAFNGIESVLRQSMETDFWYGLPERHFDLVLGWVLRQGSHGSPERRPTSTGKQNTIRFPSWSWVGWISRASLGIYFPTKEHRSEIDWFLVNDKGVAFCLNTAPYNAVIEYHEDGNKDVSVDPPPWDGCSPPSWNGRDTFSQIVPRFKAPTDEGEWRFPRYLACWNALATFHLDGQVQSLNDHGRLWTHDVNLVIWAADGTRAGSIMMSRIFAAKVSNEPRFFEFILVTRLKWNRDSLQDCSYFDESIYPNRDWCQLSVMMIEREGTVAQRIGVGIVHEDAWVNANPRITFIRLE